MASPPPYYFIGVNIPFAPLPPPNNPPIFSFSFYVKQEKSQMYQVEGKIIKNVTLIWFEDTGKTIPFNSVLEFSTSILSDFKMRNVIIWHWFIKNLVGTWCRNDVDATSLRRIDVVTTTCACWEFGPPCPPPPYSKPSYAYECVSKGNSGDRISLSRIDSISILS